MELNDVKKALYKEKPIAFLVMINKYGIHYYANITEEDHARQVYFTIPFSDIEEAVFKNEMEAKHLIRWVV